MEIRTFKESDADQTRELISRILKEECSLESDVFKEDDLDNLKKAYSNIREVLLVAEEDSKIIGVISVKQEKDDTALIKRLFVHPAYRGRNYGQTLLRRAIDFSKISGYKNISFRATDQMKAAINLCLKNGFKQINEKDLGKFRIVELLLKIDN